MSRSFGPCAILVCTLSLAAQTPDTARITGKVTDASKAPVAGVQIILKNLQAKVQRSVFTSPSGAYSFEGLPVAGRYEIDASKEGFADAKVSDIALQGG